MMPRWLWFAPLGLLIVWLALWGFRMGVVAARISETDVIETYTAYYVKTHGAPARATDCTGKPGTQDSIWIVVSCISATGARFDYPVDRFGRLLRVETAPPPVDVPKT